MVNEPTATASSTNVTSFITYVAIVLTVVMVLFPPFTSLNGTEHAFVLTGPEWSRAMGAMGAELGVTARIHLIALGVQLGAVWAIALGARWFLGKGARGSRDSAFLLVLLFVHATGFGQGEAPQIEVPCSIDLIHTR